MNTPPAGKATLQPRRRGAFRRCRTFGFALLLFATVFLYLNQVGLPNFAKTRVEAKLHERGIDLEFGRLRLRGFRTLIADQVRWKNPESSDPGAATINRAELRFSASAMCRLQLQLEALIVRRGQIQIPVVSSNHPPTQLPLDDINLDLRFLPNAQWTLNELQARFLNAEIAASGTVTNASALGGKQIEPSEKKSLATLQKRWSEFAEQAQQIILDSGSELRINFQGDAQELSSFKATLKLQAPKAKTPWGTMENLRFALDILPGEPKTRTIKANVEIQSGSGQVAASEFNSFALNGQFVCPVTNLDLSQGKWRTQLQEPRTQWGRANELVVSATLTPGQNSSDNSRAELVIEAQELRTPAGNAKSALVNADLAHSPTNPNAWEGPWRLGLNRLEFEGGRSESANFSGHVRQSPTDKAQGIMDASWDWWQLLRSWQMDWDGRVGPVTSPTLHVDQVETTGEWKFPNLVVRKLHGQLLDGQFDLAANLQAQSRELQARTTFDFDVHRIAPLFATNTQQWLREFEWKKPPRVAAEARLIFPAWTNRGPAFIKKSLETLSASGDFESGPGGFRGVPVASARSHFALTNFVWLLPDLVVARPEGEVHLAGRENTSTREFQWEIQSGIDPKALKPILETAAASALDFLEFSRPPFIRGQISGKWDRPDQIGISAQLALTNFTFRKESCDEFRASLQYTNQSISLGDVFLRRGEEKITASKVIYDLQTELVHVTNGLSTMNPYLVTKVIGSEIYEAIAPYHFKDPPTVVVNGTLPTRSVSDANVTFKIAGKAFNYWRFNVPEISGDVAWRGQLVTITNLQASFYAGKLDWEGKFDFSGPEGARFGFRGHATHADLRSLVADLTQTNTTLEGVLDGHLIITSADSRDWLTWKGYGDAQLRDGFLWNIPIFGIFSPVLNKIVPGVGQSRVNSATANYEVEKGLVRTTDLEMRAPTLRLQYVGNVNFQSRVNARVQAEILRDTLGGVGRAVSLALWPVTKVFEYKVTGTLNEPKRDLLYVPKFLLLPFHPFRTLKEVFSPEGAGPAVQPKTDASGKNQIPKSPLEK